MESKLEAAVKRLAEATMGRDKADAEWTAARESVQTLLKQTGKTGWSSKWGTAVLRTRPMYSPIAREDLEQSLGLKEAGKFLRAIVDEKALSQVHPTVFAALRKARATTEFIEFLSPD